MVRTFHRRRMLLTEVLTHSLGAIADLLHGVLEVVRRDTELLRPVAHFVILVCVDAVPVWPPGFAFRLPWFAPVLAPQLSAVGAPRASG